jgi:antitoxin PrlF
MPKAHARLTSKSQLVLPKIIRDQLKAGPGDTLVFHYGPGGVRVEKATAQDDPFAAFHEWTTREDDEAYKDL